MIVRILGHGQLRLPDGDLDRCNELDDQLVKAVEGDDEATFRFALTALLDHVRAVGTPVADDELVSSDAVLPDPDATLTEVRELLSEEGLIPG